MDWQLWNLSVKEREKKMKRLRKFMTKPWGNVKKGDLVVTKKKFKQKRKKK